MARKAEDTELICATCRETAVRRYKGLEDNEVAENGIAHTCERERKILIKQKRQAGLLLDSEPIPEEPSTLNRCQNVKLKTELMKYKVLVTLDAETAHPNLILSEDGRRVRCSSMTKPVPATPKRFSALFALLAKEGFSSGSHYWEVRLLEEGSWCVGAAAESLDRKTLSQKSLVWALQWFNNKYIALNLLSTPLTLTERPKKLGVYLNYEMAQLSIYNADTMELLCTFPISAANERVFPYFCVWGQADLLVV
ncbi:hypothetical protein NDU88_003442 [Pleurodeles waltl]|uniref:B30.2/SPRY domain-containing protein n=1 Tax=Pleurodeles waltl TaxID=8319 RepID=A0AAV7LH41_PLEWA|nr:hypothetical protein NDU88_003442 [Pleurodeles waltl]